MPKFPQFVELNTIACLHNASLTAITSSLSLPLVFSLSKFLLQQRHGSPNNVYKPNPTRA